MRNSTIQLVRQYTKSLNRRVSSGQPDCLELRDSTSQSYDSNYEVANLWYRSERSHAHVPLSTKSGPQTIGLVHMTS